MYRVAIATYKRYTALGEKTLKTLSDNNIDKSIIDIFVNNQEEYELYRPLYPDYNMIVGEVGMVQIRNYLFNHYEPGANVFCMDDDITGFKMKNGSKTMPIDNLHNHIEKGFNLCKEHNTCLFGISPTDNGYFMNDEPSTNLKFCVGWTFGVVIDKETLQLDTQTKGNYEDYERSVNVFKKYGKVIRLNNISATTKYNVPNSGGLCIGDRSIGMLADLEILKEKFVPQYIFIKKKKSSLIGLNPQVKSNIKNIL